MIEEKRIESKSKIRSLDTMKVISINELTKEEKSKLEHPKNIGDKYEKTNAGNFNN